MLAVGTYGAYGYGDSAPSGRIAVDTCGIYAGSSMPAAGTYGAHGYGDSAPSGRIAVGTCGSSVRGG